MSTAGDDPDRGESPPGPVRPVVQMRVGRLLAVMGILLAAVFGGIGWLQSQSLPSRPKSGGHACVTSGR
jgi:hypothetical protein